MNQSEANARFLVDRLVDVLCQRFGYVDGEPTLELTEPAADAGIRVSETDDPTGTAPTADTRPAVKPLKDTRAERLAKSASMISEGIAIDDVVDQLKRETPVAPDTPIDWHEVDYKIRLACYGWINKKAHDEPRVVATLPDWMRDRWQEIVGRGGRPFVRKQGRGFTVDEAGPADPIPDMEAPKRKARTSEGPDENKYPRLEFISVAALASIPPREFYLGKQYQRGAVSGTMAPGGRGKSSLVLVEAVAMATGRALLTDEPLRRLKVWYHNGEESWDELCRRLDAVCQYYGVPHGELEGWLCLTTPQKFPLRVAEVGPGDRFSPERNLLAHMYEEIRTNGFDIISMDPLITLHAVPENNPVMMRGVMDIFRDLAAGINCSVEVVGHTRKPPIGFDAQLTAYDTRGSGAIVDALRSVRMLDLMTTDEAGKAGVEEYERERHVKVTPAKRNYSTTAAPPEWIRIENLIISNGDDVGVVTPWTWPDHDPAAFEAAVQRAENVFLEVMPVLQKRGKRLSNKKGVNFAPKLMAETAEAKEMRVNEASLAEAMGRLIESGRLQVFSQGNVHELRVV